ncbi:unannotated protein [freshwater metagenome]|uniref:Unannotated protein n=1 Tax=freshwater metagenome TaxID=449393 RepID=A0A6J6LXZ5_9ZZZZ
MLEVIAEHQHKAAVAKILDEILEIFIWLIGSGCSLDVIKAKSDGLHAVFFQARSFFFEAVRNVGANRGDAIDTQGNPTLHAAVGIPRIR